MTLLLPTAGALASKLREITCERVGAAAGAVATASVETAGMRAVVMAAAAVKVGLPTALS